uniref:Uncharacterized protein n=1 Tax=Equus caballus TaxID=9796 RepID=A0A9L0SL45_HORSE
MSWGPGARGPAGRAPSHGPLRWWRLGVEGTLQKLALRRKKALNAQEMARLAWARRAPCARVCLCRIPVALLMLHVAPLAVLQMLRPCAEQRLPSVPQAPAAVSAPIEPNWSLRRPLLFLGPGPAASAVLLHGPTALHLPLSWAPGSLQFSCCLFSPFTGCRNKGSSALGGGQAVAECGSREGSGQRMSCQPIAARLLVAGMGKSPPGRGP